MLFQLDIEIFAINKYIDKKSKDTFIIDLKQKIILDYDIKICHNIGSNALLCLPNPLDNWRYGSW
jgi:hypothetical protein